MRLTSWMADGCLEEQTAVSPSRPSGSRSAAGSTFFPGSGSSCTCRGGGWAGRCGSMTQPSTSPSTSTCTRATSPAKRSWSRPATAAPAAAGPVPPAVADVVPARLADGRVGLFMKLHHAIADGVAGVAAFAAFLDLSPCAPAPSPPPWTPGPLPSGRQLFRDNLHRRMQHGRGTLVALGHPRTTAGQVQRAWPAVRETFAEGRAPRTSLNQPIGAGRTPGPGPLQSRPGQGHRPRPSCDGERCAQCRRRQRAADPARQPGEHVDGLVLRAFVPVSLHRERPGTREETSMGR